MPIPPAGGGAKLARLKQGSVIETEWFRQAQYLKWCKQNLFPTPAEMSPDMNESLPASLKIQSLTAIQGPRQYLDTFRVSTNFLSIEDSSSQQIFLIERT
jgi:hypothetical protein